MHVYFKYIHLIYR